jgi:hypothetical protein
MASENDLQSSLTGDNRVLRFPADISEVVEHWMCIRIREFDYFRLKQDFSTNSKGKDVSRIFLPMPINLQTAYAQSYDAEGIGPLGDKSSEAASNIKNFFAGTDKLESLGNLLKKQNVLDTVNEVQKIVNGSAAYLGATALEALPFGKGIMGGLGVARNPYMSMIYSSPEFRVHEFSWKLVAKDFKESQEIHKIIKALKKYSAPTETGEGDGVFSFPFFYKYPAQFDIDFRYPDYLFNIAPSVLKNVSVNYHSDGPLYHEQTEGGKVVKIPASLEISLSFQEITVQTRKDIEESNR